MSTATSSAPASSAPATSTPPVSSSAPAASRPSGPAATVAPSAGAPLASTPTPGAAAAPSGNEGGIMGFIKNLFMDQGGNLKVGTIIGTLGVGALGAYMGSGSGTFGMILGGLGGAVGGTFAGPLIQQAVDWVSVNVLGLAPSQPVIPRNNAVPNAAPDVVNRTPQPIVQPGAPTVDTTLVTPNLDRFAAINSDNRSTFTRLEDMRRQINNLPANDPGRETLSQRMLSNEGILQQYISNTEAWNTAATEWNNGERNSIITAYDNARSGLGFAARPSTAPSPIPSAPTGTIDVPRPSGVLLEVARRNYNSTRSDQAPTWESMNARQQINVATSSVEAEVNRLKPGGPSGIDVSDQGLWTSNGRGVNRTVTLGGLIDYGSGLNDNAGVYNRASNAADCQHDIAHLLKDCGNGAGIDMNSIRLARAKAQQGINFCNEGPGSVYTWSTATPTQIGNMKNNFERIVQYCDAVEARGEIAGLQERVNQSVGNYVDNTANRFPTFINDVQNFRNDVNQMNQRVASLNQSQVRILARGSSTTPPDDNKRFITVRDERNNSEVTMVAEKNATGSWEVTHSYQGGFDPAKATPANALATRMPIADIFTDQGVSTTTPNLGETIRQSVGVMQARLGIGAAPAVAPSTPAVTTTVAPPPPTPSASPASSAPGASVPAGSLPPAPRPGGRGVE